MNCISLYFCRSARARFLFSSAFFAGMATVINSDVKATAEAAAAAAAVE